MFESRRSHSRTDFDIRMPISRRENCACLLARTLVLENRDAMSDPTTIAAITQRTRSWGPYSDDNIATSIQASQRLLRRSVDEPTLPTTRARRAFPAHATATARQRRRQRRLEFELPVRLCSRDKSDGANERAGGGERGEGERDRQAVEQR